MGTKRSTGRAVGYIRVSTAEQTLGPEAQRAAIEAWAQREGLELVAVHADLGVSGSVELSERPGLVAALGDVRALGAGVLLVAKRDRLARDVYVAAAADRAVRTVGARVVCADGAGNGESASDEFMRTILDGAAAYERGMIRARTKAALQAKRARGERAGALPYGYADDGTGKLVPNEGEQGVLACVRELRAAGLTLRAIVGELAARGLVSRAGRPFGLTQVARMA